MEVRSIPNLEQYHGELKALLGFIKYQKNPTLLKQFVVQNEPLFQNMTPETVRAITVLGNARKLEKCVVKCKNEREETVDMCEALEVMIEEGRTEGGIRTLIEDNLEEGIPEERIIEKLEKRFQLSPEQARAELEKYR